MTANCPSREPESSPMSLLISTTTPAKPVNKPNTFGAVILSSCKMK